MNAGAGWLLRCPHCRRWIRRLDLTAALICLCQRHCWGRLLGVLPRAGADITKGEAICN